MAPLGLNPSANGSIDFEASDGSFVVEVKERRRASVRDLRAAVAGLAVHLAQHPHVRQACLILLVERMTFERATQEWQALLASFRAEISERLALLVIRADEVVCLPGPSERLEALAEAASRTAQSAVQQGLPRMPKSAEVLKVLLARWFVGDPAISRAELGAQAGCSYPTVTKAIEWLGTSIRQHSNRSVGLASFPATAWNELLARAPSERARVSYIDRSGRQPELESLLRRLRTQRPPHVAIGGVLAGGAWDSHFDLRGLPRIDLTLAAAAGGDLSFVERLDPALTLMSSEERAPTLVVHPLQRPATLFREPSNGELPIADPVETLLDLSELRLTEQASALMERMQRRAADRKR